MNSDTSPLLNLYHYDDIFKFLTDLQKNYPGRKSAISLNAWIKKLGYKSPRTLGMILKKQRKPTSSLIHSIASQLNLSPHQTQYLDLLCQKAKESNAKRIQWLEKELFNLRPSHRPVNYLSQEVLIAMAHWSQFVIKQLTRLEEFSDNPEWIRKKLRNKLSSKDIQSTLNTLIDLKILEKDPKTGKLKALKTDLFSKIDIPSKAVRDHHKQMMNRAMEALEEQDLLSREFCTLTLKFDKSKIKEAKESIRNFRDQFNKKFDSNDGKSVYQLNIQFFDHTT